MEKEEKKLTQTEYLAKLQKELEDFKTTLEGKSVDELKELEQSTIKEIDDFNEDLGKKEFDITASEFKKASESVIRLLDKKGYSWQYAIGMVALYEYWGQKPAPKTIPYAVVDTTLNTLGGIELKGAKEGKSALTIMGFIESFKEEYTNLRAEAYLKAEKHTAIMDAMKLDVPMGE